MRSIIRLLIANLRYKKGSFLGIMLLMAIMTLSYAITVSNNRNLEKVVDEGFSEQNIGDWVFSLEEMPSPETVEKLRAHPEITALHEEQFLNLDAPILSDDAEYLDLESLRCEQDYDRIWNEAKNGLQAHYVPLQSGEIYLSGKLSRMEPFAVGKQIRLKTRNGYDETFTVKGYYQEIVNNSVGSGILCQADFDRLFNEKRDGLYDLNRFLFGGIKYHVCVKDGTDLRALEKTLKKECTLFDDAFSVSEKEDLQYYALIYTTTGTRILIVYIMLLVTIIIIVMGNSIGTAVETEYCNLGILKANGFEKGQLRTVWILQYLLALLLGSVLGILLSVPATAKLGLLFTRLSNILTSNRTAFGRCFIAALAIMLVCTVYVYFATAKVGKISPVRAISGGHGEQYFDSRLQTRIRKRGLNFFIALRQLTSRSKSYFGSLVIVTLMVFFLCTVMIFTGGINSDLFVTPTGDIEMNMLSGCFTKEREPELQEICERFDTDAEILLWTGRYMSVDEEKILVEVFNTEKLFTNPLEGRLPKYENEVTVTELFARKMQKQIGDTVTVKNGANSAEYIITGLIQSVKSRSGVLEMTGEGGSRIGINAPDIGYVQLQDLSQKAALTEALNSELSDCLSAEEFEPGAYMADLIDTVDLLMNTIIWVVYSVTLVFEAIVTVMICRKTFLKERTDLGIFRAIGFSVPLLRLQFALRFLLISVCGSLIGCVCAACFSGKLLSLLMQVIGISRFGSELTFCDFILPAAAVCAAFFIFSYLASACVRSVSVRELVTE